MAIRDWPQSERPREKLLQLGAGSLSDGELLAIFLRTGVTGQNAVELARQLLQDFGGLRSLMAASETEFCRGKGLGQAKYVQLQAVLELSRRYLLQSLQRETVFTEPALVKNYLLQSLAEQKREVFMLLYLDSQHRLICAEPLFFGTIDASPVYPRIVVQSALAHNAAAVILAHNNGTIITLRHRSSNVFTISC